jgi:hypothetical protein
MPNLALVETERITVCVGVTVSIGLGYRTVGLDWPANPFFGYESVIALFQATGCGTV